MTCRTELCRGAAVTGAAVHGVLPGVPMVHMMGSMVGHMAHHATHHVHPGYTG